jgi:hypothetical protein
MSASDQITFLTRLFGARDGMGLGSLLWTPQVAPKSSSQSRSMSTAISARLGTLPKFLIIGAEILGGR